MNIKLITAIVASSAALCSLPAYASHCDNSTITIENTTLTSLKVTEVDAADHSKITGIKSGDTIKAKGSQTLTVSSGHGSGGNAQGEVVLLTNKGIELHLVYNFQDQDKLIGGTCHVEEASGSASSTKDAPIILTNKQDGEPAAITYFINRD